MARWHLCSPLGTSERTTEADSEFWAKRRFVPIPKGWFVASDASYQMGWVKAGVPENLCAKCLRHPVTGEGTKCEACRVTHLNASIRHGKKKRGTYGKNATSDTRSSTLRRMYEEESPEQKAARKERLRLAALAHQERKTARRRAAEQVILRGIEKRRNGQNAAAKRERRKPYDNAYNAMKRQERQAQLSLFGA